MTQEEYIAAIRKQQSLIRKLFSNRKRRSEVIDEATQERYRHLAGRFFRPRGDEFRNIASDTDYYIVGVTAESNYAGSDEVHLSLRCRYIGHTYCGMPNERTVSGLDICHQSFRFEPTDDLDAVLADKWVPQEQAAQRLSAECDTLLKNFLRVKNG